MSSEEKIREEIEKVIHEAGFSFSAFSLTEPDDKVNGDFATNIAFLIAKEEKNSPKSCADKYAALLQKKLVSLVDDTQVAGPGFINFFLRPEVIRGESKTVGQITTKFTGKKVLVEHSSPNLFKPFSVGHLMNNIEGEFVRRAAEKGGAEVKTMSFPSDVSLGIAKALMIIERDLKEGKINLDYFDSRNEDSVVIYLGEAYVRGVKECEENESSLKTSKEVLHKLYHLQDDTFYDLVVKTKIINESYFKKTLLSIDSKMDGFIYEMNAGYEGKKIIVENTGEGKVFKKSEGAIVYIPKEEETSVNTSVFINSQGYPTYEAKDLGLLYIKQNLLAQAGIPNFFPEISFFVTDSEQVPHFKAVFAAASKLQLNEEWGNWLLNSIHVPHGRMLFKGQKMSSRLGGVPLALDVISVVEEEVRERAGEKIANLSQEEKDKLTREIALSALRVAVLRSKPGININFDPETSLSFEGDSGPYLLYTHARCSSLLEKGKDIESDFDSAVSASTLERTLLHFNETLKESIEDIAPQKLVTYLFRVAQEFNSFYAGEQILTEDKKKTRHNLAIVLWTKEVLKQGLYVLGITATERM